MALNIEGHKNVEEINMTKWSCANCGAIAYMAESHNEQLRASHKTFYCVNGHGNVYNKKTNIEDIEEKLMNEYAKNAQLEARIKELEKNFLNRIFKT